MELNRGFNRPKRSGTPDQAQVKVEVTTGFFENKQMPVVMADLVLICDTVSAMQLNSLPGNQLSGLMNRNGRKRNGTAAFPRLPVHMGQGLIKR